MEEVTTATEWRYNCYEMVEYQKFWNGRGNNRYGMWGHDSCIKSDVEWKS